MNSFELKPKKGYGFIYKYTSPSGKSYIGQTIQSLKERAKTSNGAGYSNCIIFFRAIQKYGFQNFQYEILGEFLIIELDEKEKYFILKENTLQPNGYNIKNGSAAATEKGKTRKEKINQFDLNGNWTKSYNSLREAADDNNTNYQSISAVLRRLRTQHNGFIYRYDGEESPEPIQTQKTHGRITAQYDLNGNLIQTYPSANQAAIAIGKNSNAGRNIRAVCQGQRETAYGFKWKYLD